MKALDLAMESVRAFDLFLIEYSMGAVGYDRDGNKLYLGDKVKYSEHGYETVYMIESCYRMRNDRDEIKYNFSLGRMDDDVNVKNLIHVDDFRGVTKIKDKVTI